MGRKVNLLRHDSRPQASMYTPEEVDRTLLLRHQINSRGALVLSPLAGSLGRVVTLPIFLRPDDIAGLLSVVHTLRDILIVRLLYFCALRISEVLGLEVEDVDFEERLIQVRHAVTPSGRPKGRKERLVPVDIDTLRILQIYVDLGFRGRLFHIRPRHVQRLIKRYAREAGIQGWRRVTPHKLRHSFAVNWVKRGGDIERLRRILGHSSLARTQIYLQFRMEDVQEEYDRIMGRGMR